MHIPNWVKVYGSQYLSIKAYWSTKAYHQRILLSKSHWKALDQPSERCVEDTKTQNASSCIANFIEGRLGCKVGLHGSDSLQKTACNNATQLLRISNSFKEADANKIYRITGCLASCEKDEYHKIDGTLIESRKKPYDTKIEFKIMDVSYQEMEQYLIYDFNSFIADVGGFMGLLLGFSVLSMVNEIIDLLLNKCKWQKATLRQGSKGSLK